MSVVHVKSEEVETWQQKLMRRFKEEPFVPIGKCITCVQHPTPVLSHACPGTALTCFALFMASTKLGKKGESKSLNRWFRARIIFQGATIAAIVAGSYAVKGRNDGTLETQNTPTVEQLKLKERLEFEARLRKAEENYALEQAMRGGKPKEQEKGIWARLGLGRGPAGSVLPQQTTSSPTASFTSPPVSPPSGPTSTAPRILPTEASSKSSWSWFGRGPSSSAGSEER